MVFAIIFGVSDQCCHAGSAAGVSPDATSRKEALRHPARQFVEDADSDKNRDVGLDEASLFGSR